MCHHIAMRLNSHSLSIDLFIYYLYLFLELQQLNDEIFGYNPT